MPSNRVIITNETTVSKTTLLLHLRRSNLDKNLFDLCVSKQKILFERNNVQVVKVLILSITNPIFMGVIK